MNIVFHIGLHKTATTWFQKVFVPSQQQLLPVIDSRQPWNDRIMRYLVKTESSEFNPYTLRQLVLSRSNVDKHAGRILLVSAERLSGHPASGGVDRYCIASRIHDSFPEAKIFCSLRNQMEIIPSMYITMVNEGYCYDICTLLEDRNWKTFGPSPRFYEYHILVNHYHELFGKENCLFLTYEELQHDPATYMQKLGFFLGLIITPEDVNKAMMKVHVSRSTNLRLCCFLNRFRKTEYNPKPVFRFPAWMFRVARKLQLPGLGRIGVVSLEEKCRINRIFLESNLCLRTLLDDSSAEYVSKYYIRDSSVNS